jgi:hypothetical protein
MSNEKRFSCRNVFHLYHPLNVLPYPTRYIERVVKTFVLQTEPSVAVLCFCGQGDRTLTWLFASGTCYIIGVRQQVRGKFLHHIYLTAHHRTRLVHTTTPEIAECSYYFFRIRMGRRCFLFYTLRQDYSCRLWICSSFM